MLKTIRNKKEIEWIEEKHLVEEEINREPMTNSMEGKKQKNELIEINLSSVSFEILSLEKCLRSALSLGGKLL